MSRQDVRGGADRLQTQRGMSLIEVLLVVFIIGLSASLVVLTLPPRMSATMKEAQTLASQIVAAQDQAILTGQPIGLVIERKAYAFKRWQANSWQNTRGGKDLGARMELDLRDTVTTRPEDWPVLVFDPAGITERQTLRLRGEGEIVDLVISDAGEVSIETR